MIRTESGLFWEGEAPAEPLLFKMDLRNEDLLEATYRKSVGVKRDIPEPSFVGIVLKDTSRREVRPPKRGALANTTYFPLQLSSRYRFASEITIDEHGTDSPASGRL